MFKLLKRQKGKKFCQNQSFNVCSTLVVEEMSELTKELMKFQRGTNCSKSHLIEEIGDVQLTLDNLKKSLKCEKEVKESITSKYVRSYNRYVLPGILENIKRILG